MATNFKSIPNKTIQHKTFFVLSVLIIAAVILAGCSVEGPNSQQNFNEDEYTKETSNTKSTANSFKTVSTGGTQTGDVLIELTPKEIINGKLYVDINANTHSVSLDEFDLMKITNLEINGIEVPPSEAPLLSGHHASGTLSFDVGTKTALSSDLSSNSFTIIIKGIPLAEERVFKWEGK